MRPILRDGWACIECLGPACEIDMSLFTTNDGSHSFYSEKFGVTYHSKFGAITESAHVFIAAGLRYKAVIQREISILEAGFGTGLNAWMSRLEAEKRNLLVHYTGLELYPLSPDEALSLNYAALLQAPERDADFQQMHQCAWDARQVMSEHFTFEKKQSSIESFELPEAFDLIYFDAFAPQAQEELWTEAVMSRMYRSLRPDGALVTYCAKGDVKRAMKQAGFVVERLQGPPGKREMTRAVK